MTLLIDRFLSLCFDIVTELDQNGDFLLNDSPRRIFFSVADQLKKAMSFIPINFSSFISGSPFDKTPISVESHPSSGSQRKSGPRRYNDEDGSGLATS